MALTGSWLEVLVVGCSMNFTGKEGLTRPNAQSRENSFLARLFLCYILPILAAMRHIGVAKLYQTEASSAPVRRNGLSVQRLFKDLGDK